MARRKAQSSWAFWRLVANGFVSYEEACRMNVDEIIEANAALDIFIESIKKE